MNNIYDSKYNRLRDNAMKFAAERNEPVALCKARHQHNHWQLKFQGQKETPNWPVYEIAYPDGHTEVIWDDNELITL